ncbi:uncharacterized protein [Branchiostoma lanceolatum]|uniref:uncharacterized protein isoform X2 n=1 Tax=Branchiostoma lanceolatum TaxID=7740 RepID=UPI003456D959
MMKPPSGLAWLGVNQQKKSGRPQGSKNLRSVEKARKMAIPRAVMERFLASNFEGDYKPVPLNHQGKYQLLTVMAEDRCVLRRWRKTPKLRPVGLLEKYFVSAVFNDKLKEVIHEQRGYHGQGEHVGAHGFNGGIEVDSVVDSVSASSFSQAGSDEPDGAGAGIHKEVVIPPMKLGRVWQTWIMEEDLADSIRNVRTSLTDKDKRLYLIHDLFHSQCFKLLDQFETSMGINGNVSGFAKLFSASAKASRDSKSATILERTNEAPIAFGCVRVKVQEDGTLKVVRTNSVAGIVDPTRGPLLRPRGVDNGMVKHMELGRLGSESPSPPPSDEEETNPDCTQGFVRRKDVKSLGHREDPTLLETFSRLQALAPVLLEAQTPEDLVPLVEILDIAHSGEIPSTELDIVLSAHQRLLLAECGVRVADREGKACALYFTTSGESDFPKAVAKIEKYGELLEDIVEEGEKVLLVLKDVLKGMEVQQLTEGVKNMGEHHSTAQ